MLTLGAEARRQHGARKLAKMTVQNHTEITHMLYYAVVFFIIALVAGVLGFGGIAAGAAGIAKILFVVFLILAVASLVLGRRR